MAQPKDAPLLPVVTEEILVDVAAGFVNNPGTEADTIAEMRNDNPVLFDGIARVSLELARDDEQVESSIKIAAIVYRVLKAQAEVDKMRIVDALDPTQE